MERKAVVVPVGYPTSSIFIDESRARASGGRFFVVAALKVRKPEAMARAMRTIREEHGEFKGEFKFKSVTDGTLPRYYEAIDLLESSDAQVHACVVDTEVYDPFKKKPFWRVHADLVGQLLVGCTVKRELVHVLVDGISAPAGVAYGDTVKAEVNRRLGMTTVVGCLSLDSRCHDLLQVADLIAGSIAYDRGLRVATYHPKKTEKKKVVTRLKAALGGVDLLDGRTERVNIQTFRAPTRRRRNPALTVVSDEAG